MHLPRFNHLLPGLLLIFLSGTPLLYGEDEDIPIFLSIQKKLAEELQNLDLESILAPNNENDVRNFIIAQRCIEQHIKVEDSLRFSQSENPRLQTPREQNATIQTINAQNVTDKVKTITTQPKHSIEAYAAEFHAKHNEKVDNSPSIVTHHPAKNNFSAADVFRKEQYVSKSKPAKNQKYYVYVEFPSKTYHPKEVEYVWSRMWSLYGDLLQKGVQLIAICEEKVPDDALQGAVKYNVKIPVLLSERAELPYYTPSPKSPKALFTILDKDFNICTRMAPPSSGSSDSCYKISFWDFEQEMLRRN